MRFVVDAYRYIIIGFLVLIVVAISYAITMAYTADTSSDLTPLFLVYGAGLVTVMILGIGLTAVFISLHDRVAEIAIAIGRLADAQSSQTDLL
jgi:uncharacterized membrane protein YhaH (DUF805 family)